MAFKFDEFLKQIKDVRIPWAIAAFAIAAVLWAYREFLAKPNQATRKALSFVVASLCLIAVLPIITDFLLENRRAGNQAIYRVRVTVVDPRYASRPPTRQRRPATAAPS